LWSCEEPVDIGIDTKDLVIESRIEAGANPEVSVRVINGLGETIKSQNLEESEVFIQLNEEEPIAFSITSVSDFTVSYTSDCIIKAGSRYSLLIKSPGFKDLMSITEVPDVFTVRDVTGGDRGPNGGFLAKDDYFELPVVFEDETDKNNYFHLVVSVRDGNAALSNDTSRVIDFGLAPRPRDAKRFNDTGWMFSDDTFENGVFDGVFRVSKSEVVQFSKPIVTLETRSVSVDYFNYHIQNSRPKSDDFIFQGQGGVVDNVAGGTGLFGGYNAIQTNYELEFQ